jgi:long-chain acyl-CoA synthetase
MFVDAILRAAQTRGNATATICDGRSITWRDTVARTARLAGGLVALGTRPGNTVGILGLNSDRYLEAMHATWWCGGVTVPLNARFAIGEHLAIIDEARIRTVFVDQHFLEVADQIASQRSIQLICMGQNGPADMRAHEQMVAQAPPMEPVHVPTGDLAGIFYTGGTTGSPKGVMHSSLSLWSGAVCLGAALQPPANPRYLHALPMFHLGDLVLAYFTTIDAGTHVIPARFSPECVVNLVSSHGVQLTLLVPTMISMLLDSEAFQPERLRSLHTLMFGGSPIAESELLRLRAGLPQTRLCQGFGQSETVANGTLLVNEFRERSAGRALFGNSIKIVDPAGVAQDAGVVGEILVKGPAAMLGYWNNPELSAKTLTEGWVHTGDAGCLDHEGYLFIHDRLKDMIISGGENVYSAEVENAVASHAAVAQVAVIGVPDDKWGERVHVIIVPRDGAEPTLEDIQLHCRPLIASYKLPRSVELRREALPLSAVGKVAKTELRAPHWAGRARNVN